MAPPVTNDHFVVALSGSAQRAQQDILTLAASSGITARLTPTGLALSVRWRPGRSFFERPVAVGRVVETATGSVLEGEIRTPGGIFKRIWWLAVAVATAAAVMSWALGGKTIHSTSGGSGLSVLFVPVGLAAIALVVFRVAAIDGASQRQSLERFLAALESPSAGTR